MLNAAPVFWLLIWVISKSNKNVNFDFFITNKLKQCVLGYHYPFICSKHRRNSYSLSISSFYIIKGKEICTFAQVKEAVFSFIMTLLWSYSLRTLPLNPESPLSHSPSSYCIRVQGRANSIQLLGTGIGTPSVCICIMDNPG